MTVTDPQAIRIIPPATAANDPLVRLARKRAGRPFPDIAGHVEHPEGRGAGWKGSNGRGRSISIAVIGSATRHGAKIRQADQATLHRGVVAPGITAAIDATGSEFPLDLGRQAQSVKGAKGLGVAGGNLNDRMGCPVADAR